MDLPLPTCVNRSFGLAIAWFYRWREILRLSRPNKLIGQVCLREADGCQIFSEEISSADSCHDGSSPGYYYII